MLCFRALLYLSGLCLGGGFLLAFELVQDIERLPQAADAEDTQ